MNLVCWKLDKPQAEHNGWGLLVSNPLLKSNALSILWVHLCWLYLLAVDNKPRRIAHAAIFFSYPHMNTRTQDKSFTLKPKLTFKVREIREYWEAHVWNNT